MSLANAAYTRGDIDTLQRILDDQHDTTTSIAGEGPAAELLRLTRQLRHAQRDIAALDAERATLLSSEIAHLHLDAEAARLEHRDLLTELATNLRTQIAEAQYRFNFIDRQIKAQRK